MFQSRQVGARLEDGPGTEEKLILVIVEKALGQQVRPEDPVDLIPKFGGSFSK
jgi:hypothetical protein